MTRDSRGLWYLCSAAISDMEPWHGNCLPYTSPWSPCSTSCGLGISTRISNANAQCWPEQESRLCNLRPCDVDIRLHIKVGPRWTEIGAWNRQANKPASRLALELPFGATCETGKLSNLGFSVNSIFRLVNCGFHSRKGVTILLESRPLPGELRDPPHCSFAMILRDIH